MVAGKTAEIRDPFLKIRAHATDRPLLSARLPTIYPTHVLRLVAMHLDGSTGCRYRPENEMRDRSILFP
ncbi:hypothetical protein [Sphingobium sp. SYK-6]|uniref:hypothetical protein n=1 Tax=Sphingobium sp. (strain NBRC 103272 / SYK-6) TaxID=627192 RepID=UPI001E28DE43|nr:hypothetical protein [Sphingobium sp. SYK-6]